MPRSVNWYRDYVINACGTCDMTREHVNSQGKLWSFFPCALDLSVSVGFLYRIFFHRFQTIFDRIKTELSVANETINQTRP